MSSKLVVLDTNVLISISKRQFDPRLLHVRYSRILVSFVAYTEALGFNFPDPKEAERMQLLLDSLEKVPFGAAEAQHAITYRKAGKIKFPDAAILATARAAGADLLTENTRDFVGRDSLVRVLTVQDLSR